MNAQLQRVVDELQAHGCKPVKNGDGFTARCPAHDDRNPSLSVSEGSDQPVVVNCHANCTPDQVLAALGLTWADVCEDKQPAPRRIVETYDYTDEDGELLFQAVRYEPKDFRQRRPDGKGGWLWNLKGTPRVLYRLPAVLATIESGGTVYVVEGEKDANAINNHDPDAAGYVATCNPMGAGVWDGRYIKMLEGAARVVIVQDKDEAGRKHARDVVASLEGKVEKVELVEPKAGKDAFDHLAAGHGLSEFVAVSTSPVAESNAFEWARLSFREMISAETQPIPWLIEGVAAADEVVVVSAQPKDGKTYMLMQAALDASLGRPALGLFDVGQPCRLLWIDEEMGRLKLQRRFQRLCKGEEFTEEQLQAIDTQLDIRPQQGLSLASQEHFDAFRRTIDESKPDIIVMDSLVALQDGEENSATDRRKFYNRVLAPLKSQYNCAIILAAHPPLPSNDAHSDSKKRPRGSGDIIAQVDRALWMSKVGAERTADSYIFTSTLEPYRSREGGDIDPAVVIIEGMESQPLSIYAEYTGTSSGQDHVGKVYACQMEILKVLRMQPGDEIYQPTLIEHCEGKGFGKRKCYQPAIKSLEATNSIEVRHRPEDARRGKWVHLLEEEE